jgi:predicted ATPase
VGGDPDEAAVGLADVLHRETRGNPFYVAEMLNHLLETGGITALSDGRCTASVESTAGRLPDSVRNVLRARAAALGPQTAGVLSDAAVIGEQFDLALLARTIGLGSDRVLELLEAVERSGLVSGVEELDE